jgi:hypothetical protein
VHASPSSNGERKRHERNNDCRRYDIRPKDGEFEHGHRASGKRDQWLGENVRKVREWRLQKTYGVGQLPIVTEASRACRAKTDCDGGGSADVGNVRVR